MTTLSNKLAPAQVVAQLNDLANAHTDWENGTYKASNTELYALLDRCFTLMVQMNGTTKLIKELNALLLAKGIVFNDGTSLATKIARFVFNGNSKRITGYARVLRVAAAEKPESQSFSAFVEGKGGVEEVRKQQVAGTITKAEQAKLNIAVAEQHYVASEALVQDIACAAPELHPDSEAQHLFAAALVRKNGDGTLSIVYGNNKSSVVKVLLAEAGKVADEKLKLQAVDELKQQQRKTRDALARAVSENKQAA
jgi:hypothetical protein